MLCSCLRSAYSQHLVASFMFLVQIRESMLSQKEDGLA